MHPDFAGRRIGARLLDAATELARSRGLAGLLLTTFRRLPWNAPYYARLGFITLTEAAIGPDLRLELLRQQAAGLDMPNRVAMRRPL